MALHSGPDQRPAPATHETDSGFNRNDPRLLHRVNMRTVFEFFLRHGEATRPEVCNTTGLSPATASKAVKNLIDQGLLEAVCHTTQSGMGRPSTVFRPAQTSSYVLGIAIGVNKCSVIAAGLNGQPFDGGVTHLETPKTYPGLVNGITRAATTLMSRQTARLVTAGIGAPGLVDRQRGVVLMSPNFHPLDGQPLRQDIEQRLGVPTTMFHETAGTCVAAQMYGDARGLDDFVMIGIYEGFGASIVSRGVLLTGRDDMAGELGHFTVVPEGAVCGCGNRGCLETVATDKAFVAAVNGRLRKALTMDQIIRDVRAGQLDVTTELLSALSFLAIGVAGVINITNPQAVLVCSRMFQVDPRALSYLGSMIEKRALRSMWNNCRIAQATGDTGEGAVAGTIHHLVTSMAPKLPLNSGPGAV